MPKHNNVLKFLRSKLFILFLFFVAICSTAVVLYSTGIVQKVSASLIHPVPINSPSTMTATNHYAYGENAGWVDFSPAGGNVMVGDNGLSGDVWSENTGWIKLGNDNGPPYNNTSSSDWGVNNSGGNLSGYAYSENAGWVNFGSSTISGRPFGVSIDSSGNFSGYAYSENLGWISFSGSGYNVYTDWRAQSSAGTCGTANKAYYYSASADVDGTFFGSDTFCATGTLAGTTPSFPDPGNSVSWTCSGTSCSASVSDGNTGSACNSDYDCSNIDDQCFNHICGSSSGAGSVVSSITVTGANSATSVANGNTLQMHATVSPSNAVQTVTWSVVNGTGSATINSSGLLTTTGSGTVTVRAAANDMSGVVGAEQITIIPVCTDSNWTSMLSPTICPSSGSQTKTWTEIGTCSGGVSHPSSESVSCDYSTTTCTSFTYSAWSACDSSGTQTETVVSSSPSGCAGGSPVLSQSCTYVPPVLSTGGGGGGGNLAPLYQNNNNNTSSSGILDYISQGLNFIKTSITQGFSSPTHPTTQPPTNLQPTQPPPAQIPGAGNSPTTSKQNAIMSILQKMIKLFQNLLNMFVK
jgi:hypothetical protein